MAKTWLITGISSGFGRLLAETLLARGDRVIGTSRGAAALPELRRKHPEALRVVALDLQDQRAVRDVVDSAFAALGRIDIVVSNAGYGLVGAAEETEDAQVRDIIAVNLIGSIALIQAALPHLRRQGGGRILQVSSEGGQFAYPGFSLYHATKWGIEGFVETVAQEVASFGIELSLVEPGPARTDFGGNLALTAPLAEYAETPVGRVRAALGGGWVIRGDPARMTAAMIRLADQADPLPRRLLLGAAAYAHVRDALRARLDELERQEEIAMTADFTAAELARL